MNYFTDKELYRSTTATSKGIDNTPLEKEMNRLKDIRDRYLNPIRELYGKPIKISSGYRCPQLNSLIGGKNTSNHLKGEAVDLVPLDGDVQCLFTLIKKFLDQNKLPFDELIFEKSKNSVWVHLAIRETNNRSKFITLLNA